MLTLGISALIVILDQWSKELARYHLRHQVIHVIPGLFDLRYVQNTGAAWGILSGLTHGLVVLSAVVLVVLVVFRHRILERTVLHRVVLGLMVGGILGNLVDRVRLAHVVDFLDFYWRDHHFPAFNVADAAICVGVGLYILSSGANSRQPQGGGDGDRALSAPSVPGA